MLIKVHDYKNFGDINEQLTLPNDEKILNY